MNQRLRPALGIAVVAVLITGFLGVRFLQQHSGAWHTEHAVYYCPMHPTYTSDHPGDCPICNMRLVKKEPSAISHQPSAIKDICYLHNCPMVREGKPCPMLVVAKPGEKVTCPICGAHVAEAATIPTKRLLYWTDPMIPGYRADKPGKSPMGMDLVPVYEEAESTENTSSIDGYATILVSPQKQQLIGVKTQTVTRRALTKTVRVAGKIAYDPELYQAEQEYLQAFKAAAHANTTSAPLLAEQANQLVQASQTKLRLLGLSQESIDQMSTWTEPDRSLLLTDTSGKAWVYASVYEFELPVIKIGQPMTVDVLSLPGKTFQGTIRSVNAVLDPATRTVGIRAVLDDPDHELRPEMFVNATIAIPLGEVLAVPEEAIFRTGTRNIVFVNKGKGMFEPREVVVGPSAEGWVGVTSGLHDGESVVTNGNFLIDSESRLKAALTG